MLMKFKIISVCCFRLNNSGLTPQSLATLAAEMTGGCQGLEDFT